jgi:hypothetical protein
MRFSPCLMQRRTIAALAAGTLVMGALQRPASAYIEAAFALGKIIQDSTNIVLVRVESVDRENNIIVYKKVEDIKGTHPVEYFRHNVAHAGFSPREWQAVMAWAAEGKLAVICHNGGASETCIDNYWYQCYLRKGTSEWWDMVHGEPYLLRSFAGKPDTMAAAVKAIMKGGEVVIPAMVDGDKNALALRTARSERLRASMKLIDYNEARDFAGWGNEEIRPVLDMPAFGQISTLPRVDGQSSWGALTGHIQGAERADLVLFGDQRVAILQNQGEGSFDEMDLPGGKDSFGGARAAAVADYNATTRASILLATPSGPRLLTSLGAGKLRDDSDALPKRPYWSLSAAAWIDLGDKDRPAMVLADDFAGLRVLRNKSEIAHAADTAPIPAGPDVPLGLPAGKAAFEDVSDAAALGEHGLGMGMKVLELVAADLHGDGSQRLIVNGADGSALVLVAHGGKFFVEPITGLSWPAGSHLAVGDFDGDGKADIIAVGPAGIRVLKNGGNGQFADITPASGLAGITGTSALLVPRLEDGKTTVDLLVGSLRGNNRFFRNNGRGVFTETTRDIGLDRRIFNSRALTFLPAPKGRPGSADLVMVNEGQPSAILIWKK